MKKVYVASSWRNQHYPEVVKRLKACGFDVYDFRNPPDGKGGFFWKDIDLEWENWSTEKYIVGLHHPWAEYGFKRDADAMREADVCVLVLPCGRSAHKEAGWMAGAGKKVVAFIPEKQEPELMYKLFNHIVDSYELLIEAVGALD